jgi:hypothetical protein
MQGPEALRQSAHWTGPLTEHPVQQVWTNSSAPQASKGVQVVDVRPPQLSQDAQGCEQKGLRSCGWGQIHTVSFVLVPVSQSQGLWVRGGDDEADSRGGELVPSAVSELPGVPIVLLQGVAVAPRDEALLDASQTV